MGLFSLFKQNIGIDLGTSNTLVYVKGKGIIVNEPSVVAIILSSNTVCAVGTSAKDMLERTPNTISAIRPLQSGVIADFEVTKAMIKYFIEKAIKGRRFIKSNVVICVPVGVTSIEKRAVEDVAYNAGAKRVEVVEEPMAAAVGAGILVNKAIGNMIVDIGGGTTEIAVISLGGIVVSDSLRMAGDDIDMSIKQFIKSKYKVEIGLVTSEKIKRTLGNANVEYYNTKNKDNSIEKEIIDEEYIIEKEFRGRDIVTGLPRTIKLTNDEIRDAIVEILNNIVAAIKRVLEKTPPELSSDLYTNGIYLTGGGALLKGLDLFIEEETGLKVHVAENPLECVALGAGKICENFK